MLIKYLNGKVVHEQNGVARALIAAGLAEEMRAGQLGLFVTVAEFEAQKAHVTHETAWRVQPGQRIEDFQGAPRIFYSCTCGVKGFTRPLVAAYDGGENPRPGSNRGLVRFMLNHTDGAQEAIPDHILKEFNRLDGQHSAKKKAHGPRDMNPLNVNTSGTHDYARFGIKSREMLLAEARRKKG
jgi:hypothetical protein